MIIRDVSQHSFVVPNKKYGRYPLCEFLVTLFLCCCYIILLKPELVLDSPMKHQNIFTLPRWYGHLVAFGVRQKSTQTIPVACC